MPGSPNAWRGFKVTNYDNEYLGRIEDFLVDSETGRVGWAVLSCPDIDGINDRLLPVPLGAFTVDSGNRRFTINADRKTIRYAPAFDRHRRPDTGDPRWRSGIKSYYCF